MFKPLGTLLPEALNRMRVKKPVEASMVCRTCDEVLGGMWDHAVPMRAVSFRNGIVTVAVTGSAWAHEIHTKSGDLSGKINEKLSGKPVTRIKTRVAPSVARGEERPDYLA